MSIKSQCMLKGCYTVKCFVQLVSQCFGDILANVAKTYCETRNISQCNSALTELFYSSKYSDLRELSLNSFKIRIYWLSSIFFFFETQSTVRLRVAC